MYSRDIASSLCHSLFNKTPYVVLTHHHQNFVFGKLALQWHKWFLAQQILVYTFTCKGLHYICTLPYCTGWLLWPCYQVIVIRFQSECPYIKMNFICMAAFKKQAACNQSKLKWLYFYWPQSLCIFSKVTPPFYPSEQVGFHILAVSQFPILVPCDLDFAFSILYLPSLF